MLRRLALPVLMTSVLAAGVLSSAAPAPARAADALPITGYVGGWQRPGVINPSAAALRTIGVDGVMLTLDGAGIGVVGADVHALLGRAHAKGLGAELLLSNYDE